MNQPVRMFWKASSTLLASSAEVSMKERLFSPDKSVSQPRLGTRVTVKKQQEHTSKLLRILRGHSPQMSQIALVTDQHDDDVGVGVVPQFLQPPVDIIVGLVLADIVYEKSPDRTTVVGRRNRAIPLLARSIPNLGLDRLGIDLDGTGRELNADSRLGV